MGEAVCYLKPKVFRLSKMWSVLKWSINLVAIIIIWLYYERSLDCFPIVLPIFWWLRSNYWLKELSKKDKSTHSWEVKKKGMYELNTNSNPISSTNSILLTMQNEHQEADDVLWTWVSFEQMELPRLLSKLPYMQERLHSQVTVCNVKFIRNGQCSHQTDLSKVYLSHFIMAPLEGNQHRAHIYVYIKQTYTGPIFHPWSSLFDSHKISLTCSWSDTILEWMMFEKLMS